MLKWRRGIMWILFSAIIGFCLMGCTSNLYPWFCVENKGDESIVVYAVYGDKLDNIREIINGKFSLYDKVFTIPANDAINLENDREGNLRGKYYAFGMITSTGNIVYAIFKNHPESVPCFLYGYSYGVVLCFTSDKAYIDKDDEYNSAELLIEISQ